VSAVDTLRRFAESLYSATRLRNPDTESALISNVPTQVLGNRPVSGKVGMQFDGKRVNVELQNWQPARVKTPDGRIAYDGVDAAGAISKAAAADTLATYAAGAASDPDRELICLTAYLALSVVTGKLPTPDADSAENCLKAEGLTSIMQAHGVKVDSLEYVASRGSVIYAPALLDAMRDTCANRMESIRQTWATANRKRKGRTKAGI